MQNKSTSVPPPTGISLSTQAKRRSRTTPKQRKMLQAVFQEDPYPSKERQRVLAADVGFSVESLHFWFQNQRQLMRRQAKDSKQKTTTAGDGEGGGASASTPAAGTAAGPVMASHPSDLEQGSFSHSSMLVSAASNAVPRTLRQQHQERYTFYSPNAQQQQPLTSHVSTSTSEDVCHLDFYATGADIPSYHPQQQQQQQQLRLPPFSTLVPHQEHGERGGMMDTTTGAASSTSAVAAMATTTRIGEFSSGTAAATEAPAVTTPAPFTPSAFTPTRPVPLSSSMASSTSTSSSSTLVVHHRGPRPGTAGTPPIPFFFHHPEYGIEACVRQMSSQYDKTPTNRNVHHRY